MKLQNCLNKILLFVLLVMLMVPDVKLEICMAKTSENSTEGKALEAYKKFLKKNVSSFTPVEFDFENENKESYKKTSRFLVTDMDQNGIPELVTYHDIAYKTGYLYVYTYKDGKMKQLKMKTKFGMLDYINVSCNAAGWYKIYKDKKGYLHTDWSDGGDQRCTNSTYSIKKGRLWCYLEEEKDEWVSEDCHYFRINGKQSKAKKYKEKYNKLKKAASCWLLDNNSENRNSITN